MSAIWVLLALLMLISIAGVVAYRYIHGAARRRQIAIEQERLLCQQRVRYLTQLTMAAMRAAVRQQSRDDA
jgi:hypothetical protein